MSETTAFIVCILMALHCFFGFLVGFYHGQDSKKDENGNKNPL